MNIQQLARQGAQVRIAVLQNEIDELQKFLNGSASPAAPPKQEKPKRKRGWSAAARKAASQRQKARWEKIKAAKKGKK